MTQTDPTSFLPMTPVAFHVLLALEGGPQHGYGIKREVEKRTKGVIRLGAGTLYHALGSLQKRGLIAECDPPAPQAAGSSRWRFYEIQPLGARVLRAEASRLEADVAIARSRLSPAEGRVS
ncbi:MAG: PadR family transcriptional regulator [Gemmatimonadetes bacterium]|nr:PadR family transcriptional regulator [Gemmatimonadota bacterium]